MITCHTHCSIVYSWLYTLQKHLGYFNHTFRLSELHQCDQEMLIGRLSWKFIEELFFSYISLSLVSEDLFGYIPDIVKNAVNKVFWKEILI